MDNKKSLKILVGVLIVSTLVLLFLIGIKSTGHVAKEEQYKIGLIVPLTDTFSFYGERTLQGAKAALEKYPNIELIIENDAGNTKDAVSAAAKLSSIDKVNALLTIRSSISASVAEIAQQNKVPLIYSSTVNSPAEENSYVFKNFVNLEKDCEVLANILNGKKGRLLGYNLDSTQVCIESFNKAGFNLEQELFDKGEKDFKTSLIKIKEANPDFLIIRADDKILPNILRQMKELDIKEIQLICPHATGAGCRAQSTIDKFEEYFEGALGSDGYFLKTKEMENIDKELRQQKDIEPIDLSYATYESMNLLIPIVIECKGDNDCIVSELHSGTFEGIDGPMKFNSKGVIEKETTIIEIIDGGWGVYG